MDEWIIRGADHVDTLARRDPIFQELRQELNALTPDFDRIVESLPQPERELILDYLNLQLDLEARKTCLAWKYSKTELP